MLTSLAGSMRRRGFSEESIAAALLKENQVRCEEPLSSDEVKKIAASVAKYEPERNEDVGQNRFNRYPWPSPMRLEAFHGPVGELVRLVEPHTEADPVAILIQFLVAFGNAVGRGPHFQVEGDRHYTNLFANLVGETAKGRKGTSLGQVLRVLESVDSEWLRVAKKSGLSSGEGMIWAVRDAIEGQEAIKDPKTREVIEYKTVILDPGVEDKRMLVVESEFASVLQAILREGNKLSAIIRDAWDRGELTTLTKNMPARATGAHISVIGHISRTELVRYLAHTEAANGFGNRFLWACVKRSKSLPEGGALDGVDFAPLLKRLHFAMEFARTGGRMERDEEARQLWIAEYDRLSSGSPGLLGGMTARAEAQVTRLSCIYALLDASGAIERPHLEAALAVWDFCFESCRYIFGDSLGDPVADVILKALRESALGLTRTAIRDLFDRNKQGDQVERALHLLQCQAMARFEMHTTNGRPAEIWFAT